MAQPLRGPGFDPDQDIEDWSDDSSDEEDDNDSQFSGRERTDEEILAELMAGDNGGPMQAFPIRRTAAAIYMPIRVNCIYG